MEKMNKKIFSLLTLMVVFIFSLAISGSALVETDLANLIVEVNDDDVSSLSALKDLDKTDELDILVAFDYIAVDAITGEDIEKELQVEAVLRGYDHPDLIEDISDVFTVKTGRRYTERLTLKLPSRMDAGTYDLKIRFDERTGTTYEETYELDISGKKHSLEIKDIILSPENEVRAGRGLITQVRVKNRGDSNEEDIKVKVSMPALGVSASAYIDELDSDCNNDDDCDDSATSEDIYMRIPDNVETGDYTVKVEVEYDDGDETDTRTTSIRVLGQEGSSAPVQTAKTIITVGPETQNVAQGATVVYPITITNAGTSARTYTVNVDGADWATFQASPSNVVVLDAGESKAVYAYVTALQTAAVGEQMFSVSVLSGDETLKQVPLKANVTASQAATTIGWSKVKKALEIGLVVLVVLLVILGLIIGFNKLKGSEEEETKEDGQTYY